MLRIDKNFYIEKIPYNTVLRYESDPKILETADGVGKEVISKDYWYVSNIKQALLLYVHKKLGNSLDVDHDVVTSAIDVANRISELEDYITEWFALNKDKINND